MLVRPTQAVSDRSRVPQWLVEAAGPLLVIDRAGNIRFANGAACRLLGTERAALENESLARWLTDADAARLETLVGAWCERDEPLTFELPLRDADGEEHWCQWHVACAGPAEPAGDVAVVLNLQLLDAQRHREQGCRAEARKWRELAEEVCHGLWEVDAEARTLWANGFMAELLGTNPDRLPGRPVGEFVAVPVLDTWERHWADMRAGVAKQFDLRLVGESLQVVDVLVQATPRYDSTGRFRGAFLTVADITQRQAELQRLQHRESLYRLLFEHCPVALWEQDFREVAEWFEQLRWQGVQRLEDYLERHPQAVREAAALVRVERVNAAAVRLLEAESAGILLQGLPAFFDDACYEAFRTELISLWNAKQSASAEFRITTLKGNSRDVLVNVLVPSVDGIPDYARVLTSVVDISPLKKAQRDLARKEERYRLLFDHSGMSVTVIDWQGRFLMANRYACRRLNLSPDQVQGRTLWDFFPEPDADKYLQRIRHVIRTERPLEAEDHVDVAGRKAWFWSVLQPFRLPGTDEPAVQIVSHDITDRKVAEELLRENEQRLQAVVAQTPGVLWTVDRELRVETMSGQRPSLLGQSAESVVGRSLAEVLQAGGASGQVQLLQMHRRALQGQDVSLRVQWNERWYEVRLRPMRAADRSIAGVIGVALDVTEKERDRHRIELLLDRLAMVLQTIQDGFARLDPQLRVREANPALARLLGVSPIESLIGRSLDEFACSRQRDEVCRFLRGEGRRSRQPVVFEFSGPDGQRRFAELTTCQTDIAGSREIAVFLRDVTERQRAQMQRERLIAVLEQKNNQLERFADTVAHDFKGYLVNIEGFAERLLRDLQGGDMDRAEEDRLFLNRYVEQLRDGINGLVDRARRGVAARLTDVADLCEIIRTAAEAECDFARREGSRLEVHLSGVDRTLYLSCDRAALLRAVENVLRNARRHARSGGVPTVHVDVHREEDGGVLIAIRDNGPGFPEQALPHVFDCEVRADPNDSEGRGLGLYFVRNIVESHQGHVWVRNNRDVDGVPDEGATVFISLPDTLVRPSPP